MQPVLRSFEAKVDDVSPGERAIVAKISTSSIDRYNTCFDLRGCDLKAYNNNRICLWEHGKCPLRGSLPIGRNLWIRVDKSGSATRMIAKTQFKDDPFSDQLFQDYSAGFLNAWSISVLPSDFGPPKAEEIRARPELKDVDTVFRRFELCEYSATAVPGNADCVSIKEDTARALNRLIVRGFYAPPAEIKDQIDRAMTEGQGGLAGGGALVKPDDCDDDDDKDRDCSDGMKPKKRKKKDGDDDGDDDDDAPETVDHGTLAGGGGGMAIVGCSGDEAETVDRYIRKEDGKFNVYSEEGKLLGSHDTREDAVKQLQAIEANKHRSAPEPVAPEPEPEPTPEPVIELPPLTGRTFQEIVALHILEERDYRAKLLRKCQDHLEWMQGKA